MKNKPATKLFHVLIIQLMLVLSSLSHAGYYKATFSGGQFVRIGWPAYSYFGADGSGNWGNASQSYGCLSATGAITVTLTWTPSYTGDPEVPPKSVVVVEQCVATAGKIGSTTYGTATNGLGDPQVAASSGLDGSGNRISHYWVKPNPGASFNYTRSPSATAPTGPGYGTPVSVVDYYVSSTPARVTLSGARVNGAGYECMIGKGITGAITAGYTLDQWNWSIGGSTFKSYTANNSQGKVYYLTSTDLQAQYPHWYWKDASSALVTATARITFPDATTGTVTAEKGIDIFRPYNGFAGDTLSSQCYMGDGTSASDYNHVLTWQPDPSNLADTSEPCIDFYGEVGTQSRFWNGSDAGQHCYVQLGKLLNYVEIGTTVIPTRNTWGRFDLDNGFPYPGSNSPSLYFPANSTEPPPPASPIPNTLVAADGPWMGLAYSITGFYMHDTYRMTQLYRPPASDNDWAWVPLNEIEWECFASDTWPWAASGSAIPNSYVRINSSSSTTTHPEWEYSIGNS